MTEKQTIRPRIAQRLTSLLLAFVCLWISGGAVLNHTDDDCVPMLTFAAGHNTLHHTVLVPPSGPCAACQWEQSLPTLHVATISVFRLPLSRARFATLILPALHLHAFDYTSLRAPPCLVS